MKKRIFSIMDTGKKKAGAAIACAALLITMGTGFALAANATAEPPSTGNTVIVKTPPSAIAEQYANRFEKYKDYGLTYDKATDSLYFNGELVRYFEDYYPVGDNAYAGTDYFNENGTIDVHGVRDLSQIVLNVDGSHDPSGKLIGVEPYSQAEFDARDIDSLKNPPQGTATADNGGGAGAPGGSNFVLSGDGMEAFKVYAEFGLTYDADNVFRYNGKTVRRFADAGGALSFSRIVANDYDKSVDLIAVRDVSGKLTGMSVASREEFDQRTSRMEQSQREWEEFLKNNPDVTSYNAVDGGYNPSASSNEPGAAYSNPSVTGITADTASAGSYVNADYVDTSLNAYIDYSVSYDATSRAWMFNGKPIDFLIDTRYQVYMNFSADNTDSNFAETVEASNGVYLKVIRKSNGTIEKIEEMATDEAVQAINAVFS